MFRSQSPVWCVCVVGGGGRAVRPSPTSVSAGQAACRLGPWSSPVHTPPQQRRYVLCHRSIQ